MNLKTYLEKQTHLISSTIQKYLTTWAFPEPISSATLHILESGGKRVRPILALLSCEAVGGNIEDILRPAISIELIHTASLLWDDVITL